MKHLIIIAAVAACARAWGLTLSPETKIVVPDDDRTGVSAAIGEAGREIAKNVREATGMKLAVLPASRHSGGAAIYLGADAARKAGLSTEGLSFFANVVAEKGGSVYLFGNDRPGSRSSRPLNWRHCVLPTARAAARFMERFMGVRYVAPGETGCEVRKVAKVEVPDGLLDRETPQLSYDCGRNFPMMYSMANGLFGSGVARLYGGHTYPAAFPYKKLYPEHPEYFAKIGSSRRQSLDHNPAICISNPEVRRRLVAHLAAEFDAGYDVVELGQNDGLAFCECERCAAYGGTESRGEKFWIFHRGIAEELCKTHPDKTVLIISYALTAQPPRTFTRFPPNVMVEMMSSGEKSFRAWEKYEVPRGFSVYTYIWGTYNMPGVTPKPAFDSLVETSRRYRANGVRGIYRCGFGELFGMEGPGYYLFNRMNLDPSAKPQSLLEDYYAAAYGAAAGAMRSFFATLDAPLRTHSLAKPGFRLPDGPTLASGGGLPANALDLMAYIYTPATCASLEGFLSRAEATPGLTERQRRRLALTRLEFDYARDVGRVACLYQAFRFSPTKAFFDPLADAVLARNARIASYYDEKGRMKKFPGWPELNVFGGRDRQHLMHNGRLGATLNAPFTWDVALMREKGIVPGGPAKSTEARARLADAPWNDVGGMQLDRLDYKTKFRVAYDDANLYVEVEAELPAEMKFEAKGHDGHCFTQECLELFVDPTGTRGRCYHLIWNAVPDSFYDEAYGLVDDPLDPLFDQFNRDWNGKWTYETSREGNTWRSVATIPYASIGARRPEVGEKWFLNLGRETYKPSDLQVGLWNPSLEGRGMRDLESLGTVVFK